MKKRKNINYVSIIYPTQHHLLLALYIQIVPLGFFRRFVFLKGATLKNRSLTRRISMIRKRDIRHSESKGWRIPRAEGWQIEEERFARRQVVVGGPIRRESARLRIKAGRRKKVAAEIRKITEKNTEESWEMAAGKWNANELSTRSNAQCTDLAKWQHAFAY